MPGRWVSSPKERQQPGRKDGREQGSAIVDFVLVGTVLTIMFMALVQLGLTLHVRNTVIDCAAEGARWAAVVGNDAEDGVERTRELIASALSPHFAEQVSASYLEVAGKNVVRVEVAAPIPAVGLVGTVSSMSLAGHALVEDR